MRCDNSFLKIFLLNSICGSSVLGIDNKDSNKNNNSEADPYFSNSLNKDQFSSCVNSNHPLCKQPYNPTNYYSNQFLDTNQIQNYQVPRVHHNYYDELYEKVENNMGTVPQKQPVYYYANPIIGSRVDPEKDHSSSSSQQGHGHEVNSKHAGWGSSNHQKYHAKKKKKGKKGVLTKILNKFKLKRNPEKLIWKEVSECDGFENFIKDLEIIGWELGWLGFKKATIGLILHFLNQIYLTFSVFVVSLPEKVNTFINLLDRLAPGTGIVPLPEPLQFFFEIVGIIDYIFNAGVSYPVGNLIVLIEFIAEILTIASLAFATITIFDDIVEEKVWAIFGIDLREALEGYGCDNPFSKEEKIEQFFNKFTIND